MDGGETVNVFRSAGNGRLDVTREPSSYGIFVLDSSQ